MSAPNAAVLTSRAQALAPTAAPAAQSVSAPAADATTQAVTATLGPGIREAFIATKTATTHEEDAAAQAPPLTPTSPMRLVIADVMHLAHKPAAVPSDVKEFLEQFDPDARLDSKAVLKSLSPVGRDIKIDAEMMQQYIGDDGSFKASDGEIVLPYLLELMEMVVRGRDAEYWLKRFVPDASITVNPSQTFSYSIA